MSKKGTFSDDDIVSFSLNHDALPSTTGPSDYDSDHNSVASENQR